MVVEKEVSETKLGTFTRRLIPTEDQKWGGRVFLVFLVWTIFMRVVVVSSVSVAGQPSADSAPFFWSSVGIKSLVNVSSFISDTSCPEPWDFIS